MSAAFSAATPDGRAVNDDQVWRELNEFPGAKTIALPSEFASVPSIASTASVPDRPQPASRRASRNAARRSRPLLIIFTMYDMRRRKNSAHAVQ